MYKNSWGRIGLLFDLSFLFGYVWFLGSTCTYFLTLWFKPLMTKLNPGTPDDASGYISFITFSVIALIMTIMIILKRKQEIKWPWPDYKILILSFLKSCLIMIPGWIMVSVLTELYRFELPTDGNWIAISALSLCGIIHGFLLKYIFIADVHRKLLTNQSSQSETSDADSDD